MGRLGRRELLAGLVAAPMAAHAQGEKKPAVLIQTSLGDITVELDPEKAPITVKNFLDYTAKGHYAGCIFHRVIPGFMIQGGGMDKDLKEKATGAPIKNEGGNGLKNDRGTIAMARTREPDSATAQFFINLVDNEFLNRPKPDGHGYAVFGKVVKGMDVVDKIAGVTTITRPPYENVPREPVEIRSVKLQN